MRAVKRVLVGVDIGGTMTKVGLVDRVGLRLLESTMFRTPLLDLNSFLVALHATVSAVLRAGGSTLGDVIGVGVGVPGYVGGDVVSRVWDSLSFMNGAGFRNAVSLRLRLPVRLENDARVVALGEWYFGGHGTPSRMLSLTLGTGVGFGLVVDGRLREAAAVDHLGGHIEIRPTEDRCFCGLSGCLESLVGEPGLVRALERRRASKDSAARAPIRSARELFASASEGDTDAQEIVDQLIDDLSNGLNSYINLFAPDIIVLGGGVSMALPRYLQQLNAGVVASPFDGYHPTLRLSSLGSDAGILGAAALWVGQGDPPFER